MKTPIHPYNKTNIDAVSGFLCDYRNTSDYRYLFSSKEWLLAFIDIYAPKENFFIQSKSTRNHFSLSIFDNQVVFTGDPFNDFNGVFINDSNDVYDFKEIVEYLANYNHKIKWTNLFDQNLLDELEKNKKGTIQEAVIGLKILRENAKSYDCVISSRILRMYNKFSKYLSFYRVFGNEIHNRPYLLKTLLSNRQEKLLTKKNKEHNPSFEPKFNEFITKLVSFDSLWNNVFLDYCVDQKTSKIVAMSLNFIKDKAIICYLRFHVPSSNETSYGLILDYWSNSKNFRESVEVVDLTRGNEPYKYRLGSIEYHLSEFVIL